ANEGDISPNGDPPRDPTVSSGDPHSSLDYVANSFGGANLTGRRVADAVLSAWRDAGTAMHGSTQIDVRHTFLAMDGRQADGQAAPDGTIVAGLTNSYNSYVATPEEYDACAYEGSFTLWGRQEGALYRNLAKALAKSIYGGAPAPASDAEPPEASPGTPQPPTAKPTPQAGTVVTDVAATVKRFGQ